MKDESDIQLKLFFQGDDISSLCNNQRRKRGRGYTSIDEFLSNEFISEKPSVQKQGFVDIENISEPSVQCLEAQFLQEPQQNPESGYKMTLKEEEVSLQLNKAKNKRIICQKNRVTRRVKKTISHYEFSKRLLHQTLSSQLKSLNIESEAHPIFSLGKHLYSSNFNGKLKVNLGGVNPRGGSLSLFRPIKKLQEWSKCQLAEEIARKNYQLLVQKSFSEVHGSESSNVNSPVNYLTFFEEGYIINLMVSRNNITSWVNQFQVYSVYPNADQAVLGFASAFTNLKSLVGGEIRVCDLIGFLKRTVKEFSMNSQSGPYSISLGCSLRSP